MQALVLAARVLVGQPLVRRAFCLQGQEPEPLAWTNLLRVLELLELQGLAVAELGLSQVAEALSLAD